MPPSGMGIGISIIGDDTGVQRMLNVLDTALNPIAIAGFLGAEVTPYLALRAKARFGGEGDDVSGKWAPLSAATQRFREEGSQQGLWNVGAEHPINVRTHEMEDYVTSGVAYVVPTPMGSILQYPNPGNPSRSLREKLKTAQQGRTHPRTVKRPVLGLNERDLSFVLVALAFHVKRGGRPK
jgi:hypothetical protein